MKSSISLPTGLFWVFVWVGFMILYTFLDICCILAHMGYNLLAYITTILPLCAKK